MNRDRVALITLLFALQCTLLRLGPAARGAEDSVRSRAEELTRIYVDAFGSRNTGLVYHHRLDGPRGTAVLSSPSEIAAGMVKGKPVPYGYGSGIQDIALENGQLLFALCEAYEATSEACYGDTARKLFRSLKRLAEISPEPGFVPRGPHPDGKSYYRDSSRDQHAAYVEALWRYSRSPLASAEDRRFAADTLSKIAARMERNGWRILVEDNSRQAHVGWPWTQFTSIGSITLLSILGQVKDATAEARWQQLYDHFSAERDGARWNEYLDPRAVEAWPPLTLYANQFCQALVALARTESDPGRRRQIAEFLRRWAVRGLEGNVFDARDWRRLDWAGERDDLATAELLRPLGISLEKPATVLEVYRGFDRALWTSEDRDARASAHKLCYGLATVPLHAALLSGDEQLVRRVEPTVRAMVEEMLHYHAHYDKGENLNRTVILGILLDARTAKRTTE
ncbi:MAG: hypothetical protein ACOY3P_21870 [Planctomycetota bacterium]